MNYKVIQKNDHRYIECASSQSPISTERNVLDIIAACMENNTSLLIMHDKVLSEDFFNLRSGFAGTVLQKLVNYHIKAALIMTSEEKISGRFREMIIEANKGNDFRVFNSVSEAENWILS